MFTALHYNKEEQIADYLRDKVKRRSQFYQVSFRGPFRLDKHVLY